MGVQTSQVFWISQLAWATGAASYRSAIGLSYAVLFSGSWVGDLMTIIVCMSGAHCLSFWATAFLLCTNLEDN